MLKTLVQTVRTLEFYRYLLFTAAIFDVEKNSLRSTHIEAWDDPKVVRTRNPITQKSWKKKKKLSQQKKNEYKRKIYQQIKQDHPEIHSQYLEGKNEYKRKKYHQIKQDHPEIHKHRLEKQNKYKRDKYAAEKLQANIGVQIQSDDVSSDFDVNSNF